MTTQTQASAQAALDEIQTVTAVVLPEPPAAAPTLSEANPELAEEIEAKVRQVLAENNGHAPANAAMKETTEEADTVE
ncbi:hypothetical protein [uncultured Paracoccus sp.]|uniref:hypothetical protein n=1 Tax=uncultured Paracoccus sp. TaxID=189685 RepID=UPI00259A852E|nr:hypothetical protein [uncultured Paracoccus sp.]